MNTEENIASSESQDGTDENAEAAPAGASDDEPTIESLTVALATAREKAHDNWERCLRTAAVASDER